MDMSGNKARAALLLLFTSALLPVTGAPQARQAAQIDPDAGKVVVYRDEYGVPHIHAPTMEEGVYAVGYAQAEDRLEELLKNFLRGTGEMAAAFGPGEFQVDLQSRLWRHYELASKNYPRIDPAVRRQLRAYVRGINDYLAAHPEEAPLWWGTRRVDEPMVVAHSRQFMWGWPAGQALRELTSAGLTADFTVDMRSSNQMAVGAPRSSLKVPMLVIDPHLSWWGAQRFWEFRIDAGGLKGSGFNLPGSPYIGLGHNEHVAWAMTTGGPDTSDIYVLTLNPDDPLRYKYDDGWRTLLPRVVEISVKGEEEPRTLTFFDSHNGPVVGRRGNQAFVAKLAYADEVRFGEAFYLFNLSRNVEDFRKALDLNQIMPQNVMVADTGGNIYYQRTGRVPIRPEGYDFSKPVDGSTSKTEWRGVHSARDLVSVENPPQGYMQNCNIPPDVMMVGSPMTPDRYRPYLFNDRSGSTHQRAARVTRLLHEDSVITPEDLIAIALDTTSYQFENWTGALRQADAQVGSDSKANADYQRGLAEILGWNGRSDRESRGALKFYYWRQAVRKERDASYSALVSKLTDYMAALEKPSAPKQALTPAENRSLVESLASAMKTMTERHGALDLSYGQVFRVGRDEESWPVGGGSLNEEGMATPRAISFGSPKKDHTRWGQGGQTSLQVVVMTEPVQSWTQSPIGQSDRPGSPFYRDQAQKLFGPGRVKPTWYLKRDLLKHVHSRTELAYPKADLSQ